MTEQNITATVEPKGKKFFYRVFENGEQVQTRTSANRYNFVLVQRWHGHPEDWAARYSAKPKPVGAKIEYGYCAQVVPITDA